MIIFIHGADTYRSRQKLNELKEKFVREVDPFKQSLSVLAGDNLTADKLNQAVGAASLFARRRMVVVEKLSSNKNKKIFEELAKSLRGKEIKGKNDDGNIIIIREEALKPEISKNKLYSYLLSLPKTHLYEYNLLSNTDLAGWIKREFEARHAKIKPAAAAELAAVTGNDLWRLNNEINKLISFKSGRTILPSGPEEAVIDVADIKALARGNFAENIFVLTDAIGSRRQSLAFELLEREMESGLADSQLLAMVIRQFRLLLEVKQATASGDSSRQIINRFKLHPYVAQKLVDQTSRYTMPILKKIFQNLTEIDFKIKTGQADLKTSLNLLMAKI